jgi:hypothetical protein
MQALSGRELYDCLVVCSATCLLRCKSRKWRAVPVNNCSKSTGIKRHRHPLQITRLSRYRRTDHERAFLQTPDFILTSALPQTYEHACIESASDTITQREVKCADVVKLIVLTSRFYSSTQKALTEVKRLHDKPNALSTQSAHHGRSNIASRSQFEISVREKRF